MVKELDRNTNAIFDEKRKAALFVANADGNRYNELRRELANSMALNNDLYPKTLTSAYGLLEQYIGSSTEGRSNNNQQPHSYSLFSTSTEVAPSLVLAQGCLVNPNWILLDSCATVNVFANPIYLQQTRPVDMGCEIHSTAGSMLATLQGFLPFLNTLVWFHENAIANILSYSAVIDLYPTTAVTKPGCRETHQITVHLPHGVDVHFYKSSHGLFYHDPSDPASPKNVFPLQHFQLATVEDNLSHFTRRQRQGIAKAKQLYETLGFPGEQSFLRAVTQNQILNCPICLDDARNMFNAYGSHIHAL